MCGIVGFVASEQIIDKNKLQESVSTLNHRGPDCQKTWISPNGHVGLGHARLSIIDLKTGDQPLTNQTKNLHCVVNGEFYGYEAERARLQQKGHHFATLSDSEIVLPLYEDLGVKCVQHLRGEFAFIIWDANTQSCFAVRDRFGVKPLYYSVIGNTLYLASEVKALLALGVPPVWDMDAMRIFANSTLTLNQRSLYRNIAQLPPGHYLTFKNGALSIHKYWDLNYPEMGSIENTMDEETYVSTLRDKLTESIKLRLRADVPIACYLSGGLDSSAVLGFAAKHYHKKMSAFTLSFNDAAYDEFAIAKEMADKANAEFYPIAIKESDLADHFDEAIWHAETFFYNGHGIAKFLLSKAVRDAGYKVVLTGEGADELFAGYPHFRLDHILHGEYKDDIQQKQRRLTQLERDNLVSSGIVIPSMAEADIVKIPSVERLLGYTPAWLLIALQGGERLKAILTDDFVASTKNLDSFKTTLENLDIPHQLHNRDIVNQSLYLWTKFRLCDYILTVLGDRMEMAHSLEGRVPFLDHHIAEFMRDVPISLKIHDMTEKFLLREAARPVLTKTVYERQKHPFLAPPATVNPKQPFHDLLQSTLRSEAFKAVPFFDHKKTIALLDRLPSLSIKEKVSWDPILMMMLSITKIQAQFKLKA